MLTLFFSNGLPLGTRRATQHAVRGEDRGPQPHPRDLTGGTEIHLHLLNHLVNTWHRNR
jgi:hypothetical protein